MIRGLYNASSSMVSLGKRMEVATTNLANVQTNGFKQDRTAIATFAEQFLSRVSGAENSSPVGPLGLAEVTTIPETDWGQGALQPTGRELDLALSGSGFFTIETPEGIRYTRNGAFTRNAQGQLVTGTGRLVLGVDGPLQMPSGEIKVAPDGTVNVDGAPVGRLRISEFADPSVLRRYGNTELGPEDPTVQPVDSPTTVVHQATVESSNVDMTATMTTIIEIQRAYEANQRMIQSQNDLTGRAVNDIARPSS